MFDVKTPTILELQGPKRDKNQHIIDFTPVKPQKHNNIYDIAAQYFMLQWSDWD